MRANWRSILSVEKKAAAEIMAVNPVKRRLAAYRASFGTTPVSVVTANLRFAPILGLFLKTARLIHGHGHGAMRHLQRWQDQAAQLSQLTAAQLARSCTG